MTTTLGCVRTLTTWSIALEVNSATWARCALVCAFTLTHLHFSTRYNPQIHSGIHPSNFSNPSPPPCTLGSLPPCRTRPRGVKSWSSSPRYGPSHSTHALLFIRLSSKCAAVEGHDGEVESGPDDILCSARVPLIVDSDSHLPDAFVTCAPRAHPFLPFPSPSSPLTCLCE